MSVSVCLPACLLLLPLALSPVGVPRALSCMRCLRSTLTNMICVPLQASGQLDEKGRRSRRCGAYPLAVQPCWCCTLSAPRPRCLPSGHADMLTRSHVAAPTRWHTGTLAQTLARYRASCGLRLTRQHADALPCCDADTWTLTFTPLSVTL